MTQVQFYDDEGVPVLATDSGELGILWDSLAVIQGQSVDKGKELGSESFSTGEFFKRLYLARAELDICSATLELIDKSNTDNIELKAAHYQKNESANGQKFKKFSLAKKASILEAATKIRAKANELKSSTQVENDIVASTLLRLRTENRWNILRITSHRQITLYFDPSELTPIAAVNISPTLLFRTSSERYTSPEQLNPVNLAIIFRDNAGRLLLKLQDSQGFFSNNLHISTETDSLLPGCRVECLASDDIESWNPILSKVRFALMARMITVLIEKQEEVNDIILKEPTGFKIIGKRMTFSWTDAQASAEIPQSTTLHSQFKSWCNSFLDSNGQSVNFQ